MTRKIIIDPVTRIEGHAKISIFLDEEGGVEDARFHVTEFRGFEEFCVGRPLWEMPSLTARTCGICPVSHLLASAKAGDAILAVELPPAALKLRRLMNLGQLVQSHALSFFHLSAPDLLLGLDSAPESRNVFGLMKSDPELVRRGIRLRQFGQEVIEVLGGRKVHPAWAVPGGVRRGLSEEQRSALLTRLPEVRETALAALDLFRGLLDEFAAEVASFGNFPSLFMGLVGRDGRWEHHHGRLRIVDSDGLVVADGLEPADYRDFIGEAVQSSSYLKSPYYRPYVDEQAGNGSPASGGMYRVGPLARLNVCNQMGTPLADEALREYRDRVGGIARSSFFYHYARLIEILAGSERIERLLQDPEITSTSLRAEAGINRQRGVGVSEAPRGTLFHDYQVDENGMIRKVNMIIATGQNNLAMNRTVKQIAEAYIHGSEVAEGILNRIEAGIRAFDPCLSCSTHAIGAMPLDIRIFARDGSPVGGIRRD